MGFGDKLQFHRKSKSMSQEQLAAKIMVSRQAVSKWELGNSLPDTENLLQISKLLDLSIDYLLNDDIEINIGIPAHSINYKQDKKKCQAKEFKVLTILGGILSMIGLLGALATIWMVAIGTPFLNLFFASSFKSSMGVMDTYSYRTDMSNYSTSILLLRLLFGICSLLIIVAIIIFVIKVIKFKKNALS